MFKKYQHLERFGTTEVEQIELGECYVFPKIDGTNASVWIENGIVKAGSRNRELTLENDNAGFYEWVLSQDNIKRFLIENPSHRLYGEWLVPHTLKTYREDSWRKFYVFDVVNDLNDDLHLHYSEYKPLLDLHDVEYVPPISIIRNGSYEQFINHLMKNVFLIEDGKGYGEGIVLKNYSYKNKFNKQVWAKIVTSEFKEKHQKVMGASEINGTILVEEEIANKYITNALCEKTYAKINLQDGFNSKKIPQLLNTIYYDFIKEESWNFIKEHKNPTINFKTLQRFVFCKIKSELKHLF